MPGATQIKLILAYEGTRFVGWQVQPNGLSVQAVLEEALLRLTGRKLALRAAGRTDSGVHARGQVVCLPDPGTLEPDELRKALNHLLPEDVAVLSAEPVAPDFDPRGAVVGKHYRYTIYNHPVRPVFERRFSWHLRRELDLPAMRRAAACLLGEHDFSSFRASGCESSHPIRTLDRIRWHRPEGQDRLVILEVWGRAFLKQMIRNLAGTFAEIGRARRSADEMSAILAARDRRRAGQTAPACGLCLIKVYYDQEEYRRETEGTYQDG
jgi:tRNA pseudouridine38-40 synthase